MPEISTKEWKFVAILGALIIIITFLPNMVGIFAAPRDTIFWGLQTTNSRDTPVYYSWIEQAKDGHLLFKNLYTSETEPRFIFDPFWLGVGLFAKMFSLSGFAAYQLARVFLIPVFLAIAYIFISYFFKETKTRKFCFILLIFSSGISGLLWPLVEIGASNFWPPPLDLWSIESSTFYTLYHSPHFIASLFCTILIFLLTLRSFEKKSYLLSFLAGLVALFLFFFHPYHVPTIFGVIGLYIIIQSIKKSSIRWDLIKHYIILIAVSSPAIVYHLWTLNVFWTRQQFALQNNLPTPPFYNFLLSYGFLFIFGILGFFVLLLKKEKLDKEFFLLTWFPTQIILPFLPFLNFQRKMIEGLHFVMVLMAIMGLYFLKNFLERKKLISFSHPKILLSIILLLSSLFFFSSYYILVRDIKLYLDHDSFIFLKKEMVDAMVWLKNNTPQESVIFSSYDSGNVIPAFGVKPVFLGSNGNTALSGKKTEQVELFFQKYGDRTRAAFLKINKIDYLFYGPTEQKMSNFNPDRDSYLENVYQNEEISIYKVKK
ncbi:MAG: hypothetical protein WC348_01645 [Patescibacteria group bacterium]|jgi:hypothetical protein